MNKTETLKELGYKKITCWTKTVVDEKSKADLIIYVIDKSKDKQYFTVFASTTKNSVSLKLKEQEVKKLQDALKNKNPEQTPASKTGGSK